MSDFKEFLSNSLNKKLYSNIELVQMEYNLDFKPLFFLESLTQKNNIKQTTNDKKINIKLKNNKSIFTNLKNDKNATIENKKVNKNKEKEKVKEKEKEKRVKEEKNNEKINKNEILEEEKQTNKDMQSFLSNLKNKNKQNESKIQSFSIRESLNSSKIICNYFKFEINNKIIVKDEKINDSLAIEIFSLIKDGLIFCINEINKEKNKQEKFNIVKIFIQNLRETILHIDGLFMKIVNFQNSHKFIHQVFIEVIGMTSFFNNLYLENLSDESFSEIDALSSILINTIPVNFLYSLFNLYMQINSEIRKEIFNSNLFDYMKKTLNCLSETIFIVFDKRIELKKRNNKENLNNEQVFLNINSDNTDIHLILFNIFIVDYIIQEEYKIESNKQIINTVSLLYRKTFELQKKNIDEIFEENIKETMNTKFKLFDKVFKKEISIQNLLDSLFENLKLLFKFNIFETIKNSILCLNMNISKIIDNLFFKLKSELIQNLKHDLFDQIMVSKYIFLNSYNSLQNLQNKGIKNQKIIMKVINYKSIQLNYFNRPILQRKLKKQWFSDLLCLVLVL